MTYHVSARVAFSLDPSHRNIPAKDEKEAIRKFKEMFSGYPCVDFRVESLTESLRKEKP